MPTIDKSNHFRRPCNPTPQSERARRRKYFYHTRWWRALRLRYLADHPLCERCLESDIYTPAEDVHHRETFTDKPSETWLMWALNERNLMAVCKRCHGLIHKENEDAD